MKEFSHFQDQQPKMVNIQSKKKIYRCALARGVLKVSQKVILALEENSLAKGNAFTISKIAAITAAKKASEFIPLCHPLSLDNIEIDISLIPEKKQVRIQTKVESITKTGVEMEALFALSTACLVFYDMCKSVDKKILIEKQGLYQKKGGKSGNFHNKKLEW